MCCHYPNQFWNSHGLVTDPTYTYLTYLYMTLHIYICVLMYTFVYLHIHLYIIQTQPLNSNTHSSIPQTHNPNIHTHTSILHIHVRVHYAFSLYSYTPWVESRSTPLPRSTFPPNPALCIYTCMREDTGHTYVSRYRILLDLEEELKSLRMGIRGSLQKIGRGGQYSSHT